MEPVKHLGREVSRSFYESKICLLHQFPWPEIHKSLRILPADHVAGRSF